MQGKIFSGQIMWEAHPRPRNCEGSRLQGEGLGKTTGNSRGLGRVFSVTQGHIGSSKGHNSEWKVGHPWVEVRKKVPKRTGRMISLKNGYLRVMKKTL